MQSLLAYLPNTDFGVFMFLCGIALGIIIGATVNYAFHLWGLYAIRDFPKPIPRSPSQLRVLEDFGIGSAQFSKGQLIHKKDVYPFLARALKDHLAEPMTK